MCSLLPSRWQELGFIDLENVKERFVFFFLPSWLYETISFSQLCFVALFCPYEAFGNNCDHTPDSVLYLFVILESHPDIQENKRLILMGFIPPPMTPSSTSYSFSTNFHCFSSVSSH